MFFTEIDPEVDYDSRRAVYFRQMRYGLFVSLLLHPFRANLIHVDPDGTPRERHGIKSYDFRLQLSFAVS